MNSTTDLTTLSHAAFQNSLKVLYREINELKLRSNNPRTHTPKQINQIAKSIEAFGYTNPVLIDDNNNVIAGHGRIAATKQLGMPTLPTIRLEGLSEAQIRSYVIADNKLAENAGWDEDLLALEFEYLSELDVEIDLTVTGFETAEIDLLIEACNEDEDVIDELLPESVDTQPVTKLGDIWLLGKHRIYCGDATKSLSYEKLLVDQKAQLIFTDPPFNVPIKGHVSGLGKNQHQEFLMASGEMSKAEFTEFLSSVFNPLIQFSNPGSIHFICIDWRHLQEIHEAGEVYSELKNLCVWVKSNGGMGSLYRSKHELIMVFKNGSAPHINNVELGKHGRYRTNVWEFTGANSFHDSREEELGFHPTVKPVAMVKEAILDCSNLNDLILDPFGGSGTTLIAAEQSGRIARLMELDPHYVDIIIKRYEKLFRVEAVLEKTGENYSEVAEERLSSTNNEDCNDLSSISKPIADDSCDKGED